MSEINKRALLKSGKTHAHALITITQIQFHQRIYEIEQQPANNKFLTAGKCCKSSGTASVSGVCQERFGEEDRSRFHRLCQLSLGDPGAMTQRTEKGGGEPDDIFLRQNKLALFAQGRS